LHTRPELNLLIDGLSPTVTRSDIVALFSCCGTVTAVEIMSDADGLSLGVGRVTMMTKEEVRFAIQAYHRCHFRGQTLLVFEETTMNRKEALWNNRRLKRP
jgi:hypothetical protein